MVLRVGFDEFASTAKRLLSVDEAFLAPRGVGTLATAASPGKDLIVAAAFPQDISEVANLLKTAGFKTAEGEWSLGGEGLEISQVNCELYVGAVAYNSKDSKPGLWVDAYVEPRNQTQVLRAMFDELRETGELGEVSFEEFIRLANPTVVLLTPTDLSRFVAEDTPCT
jgi:hypothetical protein